MSQTKKRRIKLIPQPVTVLEQLYANNVLFFTITDLKHLNGSLYYLDYQRAYPNAKELPTCIVKFQEKKVKLFKFPARFSKKMDSKIFFHFHRKKQNLLRHAPKSKDEHQSDG